MGLLFMILAVFIIFAENKMNRSKRQELEAVNNRLLEREKADQTLRTLQRRLLSAQESERNRLSRELHDEIGQDLTGIKLLLERIPRLSQEELDLASGEGQIVTANLIDKVQDLSTSLLPSVLVDLGLTAALRSLIRVQRRRGSLNINFESSLADDRFDSEIEIAAYRIVQESLTNVNRHASADEATVRVLINQVDPIIRTAVRLK